MGERSSKVFLQLQLRSVLVYHLDAHRYTMDVDQLRLGFRRGDREPEDAPGVLE